LAASIDELVSMGTQQVWEHDLSLADAVIEGASSRGMRVASPTNENERSAIVSIFPPEGAECSEVVRRLQEDFGILVTNRSGMIRVSPHIDNSLEQVQLLFDALDEILGQSE
jgi:selenocysteine lyase/cysteine desulfurase